MSTHRETLQIVRGSAHPDNHVNRLCLIHGHDAQADSDVIPSPEVLAALPGLIQNFDLGDAHGRHSRLDRLACGMAAIALEKKSLIFVNDIDGWTVTHGAAVIEPERSLADRGDVI